MAILQMGLAKSGNFWLYKIIQKILREGQWEEKSFIQSHPIYEEAKTWNLSNQDQAGIDVLDIEPGGCFVRISTRFSERVKDLDDYVSRCNHVWTHSPVSGRSEQVLAKFEKTVYIIRDPRDIAISMSRFAFTPYAMEFLPHSENSPEEYLNNRFEGFVRRWVQHVGGYLLQAERLQSHVMFYEKMAASLESEVKNLAVYLGVPLDDKAVSRIAEESSFSSMKKNDPQHVRKGSSNEWVSVLNENQKKFAAETGGRLLSLLNYPLESPGDAINRLPGLPVEINADEIRLSLRESRPGLLARIGLGYEYLKRRVSSLSGGGPW